MNCDETTIGILRKQKKEHIFPLEQFFHVLLLPLLLLFVREYSRLNLALQGPSVSIIVKYTLHNYIQYTSYKTGAHMHI